VLDDAAKEDAYTAKVYESFRSFLDTTSEWTRIGDEGFVQARRG